MRFKSFFEIDSQDPVSNSAGHPRYKKQRISSQQHKLQFSIWLVPFENAAKVDELSIPNV